MIKNYIFDFGQVLVEFNPEYLTSIYVNNEADIKAVSKVVFDRLYWDKLDKGTITDNEVKEGICSRLPKNLHKSACKAYDNWIENLVPIDEVVNILAEIKDSGCNIFLLSNISKGFAEKYKMIPKINNILSLFDGLVFSGEIGITKPNEQIFIHLLNSFNLKAKECVFIDDNMSNIIGAEKVGIKGYRFDGNISNLKSFLTAI